MFCQDVKSSVVYQVLLEKNVLLFGACVQHPSPHISRRNARRQQQQQQRQSQSSLRLEQRKCSTPPCPHEGRWRVEGGAWSAPEVTAPTGTLARTPPARGTCFRARGRRQGETYMSSVDTTQGNDAATKPCPGNTSVRKAHPCDMPPRASRAVGSCASTSQLVHVPEFYIRKAVHQSCGDDAHRKPRVRLLLTTVVVVVVPPHYCCTSCGTTIGIVFFLPIASSARGRSKLQSVVAQKDSEL